MSCPFEAKADDDSDERITYVPDKWCNYKNNGSETRKTLWYWMVK